MKTIDLKVIETRLSQHRLELLDVAALLEEVKRLRMHIEELEVELADVQARYAQAKPVWDAYQGTANFPEMALVLHTLLKRMDHTVE